MEFAPNSLLWIIKFIRGFNKLTQKGMALLRSMHVIGQDDSGYVIEDDYL